MVGVGHLGLSSVDERNQAGGAREARALDAFRRRVYVRWRVPASPAAAGGGDEAPPLPLVLFVLSKRTISNAAAVLEMLSAAFGGRAVVQAVRWEEHSFRSQLELSRRAAVMLCGVGTAQVKL